MVQQLSLSTQVPSSKVQKLLLTLETLTSNIQSEMNQHSIILKPRYPFTPEIKPGKVGQIESYFIRMNRIWEAGYPSIFSSSQQSDIKGESILRENNNLLNDSIWTLQLSDIPAGGKTAVSIQNIYEATIYQSDDIFGYLDELGYIYETEFWKNGVRFFYGNIIIEVYRLYILHDEEKKKIIDSGIQNSDEHQSNKDLQFLKLLDKSGNCFVKAYVNVGSLNDVDSVSLGTKQLESLKRELSEIIELHVPDRLAMDSRINSRIANVNSKQ